MRENKFRAWDEELGKMYDGEEMEARGDLKAWLSYGKLCIYRIEFSEYVELKELQYTGLTDKNGQGCCEVYEGDIITIEGKIRGNIYENEPRETDIVIPPIGTKAWNTTYKKTLERGFDYAE